VDKCSALLGVVADEREQHLKLEWRTLQMYSWRTVIPIDSARARRHNEAGRPQRIGQRNSRVSLSLNTGGLFGSENRSSRRATASRRSARAICALDFLPAPSRHRHESGCGRSPTVTEHSLCSPPRISAILNRLSAAPGAKPGVHVVHVATINVDLHAGMRDRDELRIAIYPQSRDTEDERR
jgi:hypothetical protein